MQALSTCSPARLTATRWCLATTQTSSRSSCCRPQLLRWCSIVALHPDTLGRLHLFLFKVRGSVLQVQKIWGEAGWFGRWCLELCWHCWRCKYPTRTTQIPLFCMNRTLASTLLFSVKSKYLSLLLNIELSEPEVTPLFLSFYLKHILSCIAIFPLMHPRIDLFMPCHNSQPLGYWVVSLILTTINLWQSDRFGPKLWVHSIE
jgi:hypothetical protein